MRALLDVNLLVALHDPQHVHHALAADWFGQQASFGWASCPITQNGCLRVMSQPAYPNALPLQALMAALGSSCAAPAHEFWPDDLSLLDRGVFRRERIHGHRQLTDLYLLALAVRRGGRFATLDARIPLGAVPGAGPQHLVVL